MQKLLYSLLTLFLLLFVFICPIGKTLAQDKLDDYFFEYEVLNLNTFELLEKIMNSESETIKLQLLGFYLELKKSSIISENYFCSVVDQSGVSDFRRKPAAIPLNGYTTGRGRVSITIGEDFIQGFIRTAMHTFYIEPIYHFEKEAPGGQFVLYNVKDVKPGREMTCGVNESHRIKSHPNTKVIDGGRVGDCYEVEFAIAADYLMFQHYGSVAAVEAHNIAVLNDMQTNYDDEFADEVQFILVQQFIVSTPGGDPWSPSTNPNTLLNSFTSWGPTGFSATHDLATLWTRRDLDGTTIGLAWLNAVCTSSRYSILEDFSNNANLKRVLMAHEVGHNFNANHDAGGSPYIMAPAVQNTNLWSTPSITAIQNHYLSRTCLAACTPATPYVNFLDSVLIEPEYYSDADTLYCGAPYKVLTFPVRLQKPTASASVVEVAVLPTSTATQGMDFQLITPTLNFPAGTANTQYITIHLVDDGVDENDETIILDLNHISGPAVIGGDSILTITIADGVDQVSNSCCSPGSSFQTYGNHIWNTQFIFNSNYEDARNRFLYLPSQLTAAGITPGWITGIAIQVGTKYSTIPFSNFRVGMKNVSFTTIEDQPWIATDEVYLGNYTTTANSWNVISFDNPYYWDGTSALYFEFCFDNTTYSMNGNDVVAGTNPIGGGSDWYHQWMQANNASGCTLNTTQWTYNPRTIQPRMQFYRFGGAIVENTVGKSSKSTIKVGDVVHLYSADRKIIASIKNLGTVDLSCVVATVETTGTGKNALPFGGGDYSQKTIKIEADSSSVYEVTLYYTNAQMTTWGANAGKLNVIKSSTPIASSTINDVQIIRPDSVFNNLGPDNAYAYKGTFTGFSWFGLTDRNVEVGADIADGDLVFSEASAGILFGNKSGDHYKLSVLNGGVLSIASHNANDFQPALQNRDLKLNANSSGVIFKAPNNSLWKMSVNNSGAISVNSVTSLPAVRTEISTGNFAIQESGGALILRSPNAQCWRLFVNENGQLRAVNVICP